MHFIRYFRVLFPLMCVDSLVSIFFVTRHMYVCVRVYDACQQQIIIVSMKQKKRLFNELFYGVIFYISWFRFAIVGFEASHFSTVFSDLARAASAAVADENYFVLLFMYMKCWRRRQRLQRDYNNNPKFISNRCLKRVQVNIFLSSSGDSNKHRWNCNRERTN